MKNRSATTKSHNHSSSSIEDSYYSFNFKNDDNSNHNKINHLDEANLLDLPPESSSSSLLDATATPSSSSRDNQQHQSSFPRRLTGVLFKRRDVFQTEWRPRYFTLDSRTGYLSYSLIDDDTMMMMMKDNNDDDDDDDDQTTRHFRDSLYLPGRCTVECCDDDDHHHHDGNNTNDHERGTFVGGSGQLSRRRLTVPGKYYAFSVTPISSSGGGGGRLGVDAVSPPWYLSTTSEEERNLWIERIVAICCSNPNALGRGGNSSRGGDEGGRCYHERGRRGSYMGWSRVEDSNKRVVGSDGVDRSSFLRSIADFLTML